MFQFPQAQHSGCYFHYCQALYRKIQSLGLSTAYRDEERIRDICRQLMAMPLLPIREIEDAFDELVSQPPPQLIPFIDYFRNFWLGQTPIELWNVCDLDIRTNNQCEGMIFS